MRRADVEAVLVERADAGMRPATLSQRFRSLQQFFKCLAAEGEIEASPMATMRPPLVPETPPPVLREDDLRKLLDACAGTGFEDRRDNAMIRLFLDSGMRRSELAGRSWRTSTSTRRRPSSSARAAGRARAPSATRPARRSTAISGRAHAGLTRRSPGCGSASAAG